MKKIIAAAVATAFVAPAFAAEVTVSGAYDMVFVNGADSNRNAQSSEFKVGASNEMDNGLSVSAYIEQQASSHLNYVEISGGFGSIAMGTDGDSAISAYEDKTDIAKFTGGDSGMSSLGNAPILFQPNLGIPGLTVGIGYDADGTEELVDYGIQYSAMGVTISYAAGDYEGTDSNPSVISASFSSGPVYIAVDSVKNEGGVEGEDSDGLAASYSFGAAKLYAEDHEHTSANNETTVIGVSYSLGGGVSVYAEDEDQTAGENGTYIGVEYNF